LKPGYTAPSLVTILTKPSWLHEDDNGDIYIMYNEKNIYQTKNQQTVLHTRRYLVHNNNFLHLV